MIHKVANAFPGVADLPAFRKRILILEPSHKHTHTSVSWTHTGEFVGELTLGFEGLPTASFWCCGSQSTPCRWSPRASLKSTKTRRHQVGCVFVGGGTAAKTHPSQEVGGREDRSQQTSWTPATQGCTHTFLTPQYSTHSPQGAHGGSAGRSCLWRPLWTSEHPRWDPTFEQLPHVHQHTPSVSQNNYQ